MTSFFSLQWGLMQGLAEERQDSNNPLNPGNFKRVKLIPDGAAKFTRAMGMICKFESIGGFGERSWRYSAVFNDMKIEKIFAEVRRMALMTDPIRLHPRLWLLLLCTRKGA